MEIVFEYVGFVFLLNSIYKFGMSVFVLYEVMCGIWVKVLKDENL